MRDEDGMKWLPAARLVQLLAADGARRLAYVDLSGAGEVVPFTTGD